MVLWPTMELKDKVAVVTGGGRRLGQAIVEAVARAGARPVIHYHRSREAAHALAHRTGGVAVEADLSAPEGPHQLAEAVLAIGGELALWVNNAGSLHRASILEADDQLWDEALALSVRAPAILARLTAPAMIDGGLIVNITDAAAERPWPGHAPHTVAKAGLAMLTRCLAVELGPRLRVCAVSPGLVLPGEDMSAATEQRLHRRIPLRRTGEASDVARAVLFLCENAYLTGMVLTVDGGLSQR